MAVSNAVLMVEDDPLIGSSLERALTARGYEVELVTCIAAAIEALDDEPPPDLILLDLGLPDGDGTTVAEHAARRLPSVPVIILTARDDEVDVVIGLEAGAVDYVTKPFRLAELLARIDSHLRLRDAIAGTGPTATSLTAAGVTVDRAARRAFSDGVEIALRPKEFDLLERLVRDAGAVVTREQLIDDVWDENWWGSTKTLDVHVNSLRRKLGERAGESSRITTIRGVGYRFEREPAEP